MFVVCVQGGCALGEVEQVMFVVCVQGVCALGEVEQVMFVVCVQGRCAPGEVEQVMFVVCVQGGCAPGEVELVMFVVCVQGVCALGEVELVDGEGATEFVEAEGGGFDEGQGAKNVSSEVDAENLVGMLVHQYARMPHSNGTIGCIIYLP